jgi:hypothetical protein
MARKKKIIEEEPTEEEVEEFDTEELTEDQQLNKEIGEDADFGEGGDEEDYNTSMQIGAAIHKQSDILKRFPQLAKEVKYSFFNEMDKKHFHMRSKTYQDLNYMKVIFNLSYFENVSQQALRKTLYIIKTKEDLRLYLDATNQTHLWYNVKDLSKENFNLLIVQLNEIREDGILDSIYSQNNHVTEVYKKLTEGEIEIDAVDEMGLINDIYTTTEASKAKSGNERKSMNTTISHTIDQNEREEQQEKGENPFASKVKSFIMGKPKQSNEDLE